MNAPSGFSFELRNDELIEIFHHEKLVTTLRGREAVRFRLKAASLSEDALQHRMARLTGNYKRGNERRGA